MYIAAAPTGTRRPGVWERPCPLAHGSVAFSCPSALCPQMVVCKFAGFPQPMAAAAEQVIEHLLPVMPSDPLSFGPPTPPGATHENVSRQCTA